MESPPRDAARLHDVAVLLPCVGLLLLMPPFIGLFSPRLTVLGIPVLVLYLFGVWALLIAAAAVLARRLDPPDAVPRSGLDAPPDTAAPPA